jgi:hypothetical protein
VTPLHQPHHLLASATGRLARAVAELGEGDEAKALAPIAETLCTSLVAQLQTYGTPSMVLFLDDDAPFCGTPLRPGHWYPEPLPIGPAGLAASPLVVPPACQEIADELGNLSPSDFSCPQAYQRARAFLQAQLRECIKQQA